MVIAGGTIKNCRCRAAPGSGKPVCCAAGFRKWRALSGALLELQVKLAPSLLAVAEWRPADIPDRRSRLRAGRTRPQRRVHVPHLPGLIRRSRVPVRHGSSRCLPGASPASVDKECPLRVGQRHLAASLEENHSAGASIQGGCTSWRQSAGAAFRSSRQTDPAGARGFYRTRRSFRACQVAAAWRPPGGGAGIGGEVRPCLVG